MEKEVRNVLASTTLAVRRLLEEEFARQIEGTFDIFPDGRVSDGPSEILTAEQRFIREKIVASIERRRAKGESEEEAVYAYMRECAFTFLNRLAAFKMMESRGLVQECVSRGADSSGFKEFTGLVPGLAMLPDKGYRLYLECLCDEIGREVGVLFNRNDSASLLWPARRTLDDVLEKLNDPALAAVWREDETIGWVYQYYNDPAERKKMRDEASAPRNSRELAVRNQFFTPRYVVEFLTDNTLGRIWYEMTRGETKLKEQCHYLVRRPTEIFLTDPRLAHERIFGKSDESDVPTPPPAYRGDLSNLPDDGSDSRWISVAIPPGEFPKITGEPYEPFADNRVGRILNDIVAGKESPDSRVIPLVWAALASFTLNDGSRGYSRETWAKLWAHFCGIAQKTVNTPLSQSEHLQEAIFIPHRQLKDPRTILMLDPACGSMHFGLYAFDLFKVIYNEAWELEETFGAEVIARPSEMQALRATYATKQDFLKDVPRLIIEHNIHGVDIDPRAAQIAGLALWLRAQKEWQGLGLTSSQRPVIRRSNVVCAEPMPGDSKQLKEFCASLKQPVIGRMVEAIFEKMKLAGEAGSLLKIEEEIRDLVHGTKLRWTDTARFEKTQDELFSKAEIIAVSRAKKSAGPELDIDFSGITDETFWGKAEEKIYAALRDYSEQSETGGGFQRRLFAEDAGRGFAFIDVCRKRYDVALMNPPFGESASAAKDYIEQRYPKSSADLFAAFVDRSVTDSVADGFVGVISTEAGFFRRTLESWRKGVLLEHSTMSVMAHFGGHVLDGATVRTASYVLATPRRANPSLFLRLLGQDGRETRLLESIREIQSGVSGGGVIYQTDQSEFEKLPYAVFGYWCSSQLRNAFVELPKVEDRSRVRQGLASGDDFRFLRLRWEIPPETLGVSKRWVMFAKGGEYSPYHDDIHLVVLAAEEFEEMNGFEGAVLRNVEHYGKQGITYPRRTNKRFAPRIMPAGCAFGDKGPAIVDIDGSAWALAALLNSRPLSYLIGLALGASEAEGGAGANSYEVGLVQRLPLPFTALTDDILQSNAKRAWTCRASGDLADEVTAVFTSPFAFCSSAQSLRGIAKAISENERHLADEYKICLHTVDDRVCELFKFSNADRADIEQQAGDVHVPLVASEEDASFLFLVAFDSIQYALGVAFGRWDICYATGEKAAAKLPEPFAPLPACPPGQLRNPQGSPARVEDIPAGYPVRIPWDGILVDDPNHPLDIESRVREVIEIIWVGAATKPHGGNSIAEAIERESCDIFGVKSVRDYFRKPAGFFADHLKRYSKSRRQAPIYWPLCSPDGLCSVWVYYHRLTADTFFTILREFVKPKLEDEERHLFNLKQEAGPSPAPSQARDIGTAADLVEDLRAFRDELQHIAPLWHPNLNDGVIINHAPLWRLAPHAPWRKALKETWDALAAGDYDWAHLALHLWPERVIPNCANDRSLAIAHNLETFFWVKDPKTDTWSSKKRNEREITALVAERSSPAVKAALESLRNAPAPSGGSAKRGRKTKEA